MAALATGAHFFGGPRSRASRRRAVAAVCRVRLGAPPPREGVARVVAVVVAERAVCPPGAQLDARDEVARAAWQAAGGRVLVVCRVRRHRVLRTGGCEPSVWGKDTTTPCRSCNAVVRGARTVRQMTRPPPDAREQKTPGRRVSPCVCVCSSSTGRETWTPSAAVSVGSSRSTPQRRAPPRRPSSTSSPAAPTRAPARRRCPRR